MKISTGQAQSFTNFPGKGVSTKNSATDNPAFVARNESATAGAQVSISANSAANSGRKDVPPGLERVLNGLQSTPAADLTGGQMNAMTKISRNIARYLEVQAMGGGPVEPVVPSEAVEAAGSGDAPETAADPGAAITGDATSSADQGATPNTASSSTDTSATQDASNASV